MSSTEAPQARGSRVGSWGAVTLLVAAVALGLYVYKARTPDLALEVTQMPKQFREETIEIEFFVRFDEPDATIEIVGRNQVVAKTLDESRVLSDSERVRCTWDGTSDSGNRVEPGRYRLRVTLPSKDRVMVFPRRVDVKRASPLFGTPPEVVPAPCDEGDPA